MEYIILFIAGLMPKFITKEVINHNGVRPLRTSGARTGMFGFFSWEEMVNKKKVVRVVVVLVTLAVILLTTASGCCVRCSDEQYCDAWSTPDPNDPSDEACCVHCADYDDSPAEYLPEFVVAWTRCK